MHRTIVLATLLSAIAGAAHAQSIGDAEFVSRSDVDGDASVTARDITQRRMEVFVTLDADGDLALDRGELSRVTDTAYFSNLEGAGAEEMASFSMAYNDLNGNGIVTFAEFEQAGAAWASTIDMQ